MKITRVKAGDYETTEDRRHLEDCGQKCRFGKNWWFWLPRLKSRLWTKYKYIELQWLCYSVTIEGIND